MTLPFTISKTYSTELSKETVLKTIDEVLTKKFKFLFFSIPYAKGSLEGARFKLREIGVSRSGGYSPKLTGEVIKENPLLINVKIAPNYFSIIFFLTFPIVFSYSAFTAESMTINGVSRVPDIYDRIDFALFGGGIPLVMCYFLSIRPIKKTEKWIKEKLKLVETTPADKLK